MHYDSDNHASAATVPDVRLVALAIPQMLVDMQGVSTIKSSLCCCFWDSGVAGLSGCATFQRVHIYPHTHTYTYVTLDHVVASCLVLAPSSTQLSR